MIQNFDQQFKNLNSNLNHSWWHFEDFNGNLTGFLISIMRKLRVDFMKVMLNLKVIDPRKQWF